MADLYLIEPVERFAMFRGDERRSFVGLCESAEEARREVERLSVAAPMAFETLEGLGWMIHHRSSFPTPIAPSRPSGFINLSENMLAGRRIAEYSV